VIALLGLFSLRGHRQAAQEAMRQGEPVPDGELPFLRWLVAAQALALLGLTCGQFRGLPLPLLILAMVAVLVQILTKHTRLGRALYAIGGNEEAAVLSGIPVGKVVVTAYTLLGALVGLTGLLQTAYAGASTTTVGELMELDAVAACVIGGCSLRGGRGSVAGVLLGSLVMACLLSGMSLLAVPPEARFVARGLTLGLAAWLDVRLSKMSKGSLA
jgi:D-xylose transport system permease protein